MRWPFHFGRSAATEKNPSAGEEAQAAPVRRDWASLPAIQRAIGETELTVSTREFVSSLAGEHEPDLSLAPLGHNVSLEGPPGLVAGIAVPVRTYAAAAELVGRPRRHAAPIAAQRRAIGEAIGELPVSVEPSADPEADLQPATSPEPDVPAVVRPVVPIEATPVTHAPLTQVSVAARGELTFTHPVQRELQSQPVAEGSRLEPVAAETVATVERPAGAQRLTLGQSRRLGLGAPIPSRPTLAAQRSVAEPALELPLAKGPTTNPPAETRVLASTNPVEPVSEAIGPLAPVRRSAEGVVTQPVGAAQSPPAVTAQRVVAHSLPPLFMRPAPQASVPIVSSNARSLATRLANATSPEAAIASPVQRQSEPASPSTSPIGEPGPILLHAGDARPWPELATPNANMTAFDLVPAAAWSAPPASSTARTVDMPAMPPAAVQRIASPAASPQVPAPPSMRRTAAPGPTDPMPLAPIQAVQSPAVQREEPASEGAISPATPSAAAAPAIAPSATAGAAPAAASPSAGAAPGHESEKDLDELARKLQDRISAQIRYELLVERERAGMVTDLR